MARKIKIFGALSGYNLAAKYYDKKEKYLNSFEKNKLLPLLGDMDEKKILDVGAGTGRLSLFFKKVGAQVIALDISPKMLEILRSKDSTVKTIVGDAEKLPFNNNTFDIVAAAFLIVHLNDPTRFFDEAYRVLKDGGLLVFTNINQKEAPLVKTTNGEIKIESFYHRPDEIKIILNKLAFKIEKELLVKEGDVWVNQIVIARK